MTAQGEHKIEPKRMSPEQLRDLSADCRCGNVQADPLLAHIAWQDAQLAKAARILSDDGTDDLVSRLRSADTLRQSIAQTDALCAEAADRIQALKEELSLAQWKDG